MKRDEAEAYGEEFPHNKVGVEYDEREWQDGSDEGAHIRNEIENKCHEAEEELKVGAKEEQNHRRAGAHNQRYDAVDLRPW